MTHILIPRTPSMNLLRPFIECPTSELDQAWAAMVRIAEVQHARSGSQCQQQIEEPTTLAGTTIEQYARMFDAACVALGQVSDCLGINSDINPGAEPIIAAIEQLRAGKTHPVLDDRWKARMLDGRAIERDAQGLGEHPDLPWLDEGMNPPKFFEALGLELAGVSAQDQLDVDAYDAMAGNYDAKEFNFAAWTPASPEGTGWCLVSIHDTEDGPVAWWLREQPYVAATRPVRRAQERDDLTVEECREYLRNGWTRVRGRTEQALMLQLCEALEAGAAPAAVAPRGEYPHEQMDAMALDRYKVVPSNASMLWSHAVVAGDGTQQLYVGREVECQNMVRKFAGAFLDGAFAFHSTAAAPTAPAAPALEAPAAPGCLPLTRDEIATWAAETLEEVDYPVLCKTAPCAYELLNLLEAFARHLALAAAPTQQGSEASASGAKVLTDEDMEALSLTHGLSGDVEEMAIIVETMVLDRLAAAPQAPAPETVAWLNKPIKIEGGEKAGDLPPTVDFKRHAAGHEWLQAEPLVRLSDALAYAKAMAAAPQAPAAPVDDLAQLVKQLVQALRKAAPNHVLPAKALDYLRRQDLLGSPLRAAPAAPAVDAPVPASERMTWEGLPFSDALTAAPHAPATPAMDALDAARLDWLEEQAKQSPTGISFDYVRHAEDGQVLEKGWRFMRRHFLGERKSNLRAAIDAAQAAAKVDQR